MKIAVVHSYYSSRQPSGENIAVDSQVAALRSAGHEVKLVSRRTDNLDGRLIYSLRSGFTVATGHGASPLTELRAFGPDIVHIHNLFPNWGTSWLEGWSGPLIVTLHNFRSVCAAGTLYRAGARCEECPTHGRGAALRHACYRGSRMATLPVALSTHRDVSRHPVIARADRVIALSQRSKDTLVRFGLDTSKTDVIANFVAPASASGRVHPPNGKWIYIGRLSHEKGVLELLAHWPAEWPLDIVGDGPLASTIAQAATSSVRLVGPLPHQEILHMLPYYTGLAFPSRCQEGAAPLVALEAFASGLPVVATPGNSAADVVAETGAGLVVSGDVTWETAITAVSKDPRYRSAALAAFEQHFSPRAWLREMDHVYRSATGRNPQ